MKITEITNKARKVIKKLQGLYLQYTIDSNKYEELIENLEYAKLISNSDILKEVNLIYNKLQNDLIEILKR